MAYTYEEAGTELHRHLADKPTRWQSTRWQDNSLTNQLADSQLADKTTRWH